MNGDIEIVGVNMNEPAVTPEEFFGPHTGIAVGAGADRVWRDAIGALVSR